MSDEVVVHQCCGCSCDVCGEGHNTAPGQHTNECWTRLLAESERDLAWIKLNQSPTTKME